MPFEYVRASLRAQRRRSDRSGPAKPRETRRRPAPYLTIATLVRITKRLPRVREGKVRAALKRLARGTYSSENVARAIAERLLRERALL
ncbi:MAG: hypothetical protein FJ279_02275 [Planctomycetes bacterium]|nr:hypothetical protein [Planctomycetota bacterium]MBM4079882.1 hypothetical protein [Planctomycetota bacterium]MBM4084391.1 hypothetical protein [Planctomycetota bacterium]